jgi:hypothetical protein
MFTSLVFFGLKETKLLILKISELKDKVDLLTAIISSYSLGISFEAIDEHILEKNFTTPLGLLIFSPFGPL